MSFSGVAKNVSDGALFQLGANGAEEMFTVCDPKKTFFRQGYAKHTPFAYAQLDVSLRQDGLPAQFSDASGNSVKVQCDLPKHGNVLVGAYFRCVLNRLVGPLGSVSRDAGGLDLQNGDEDLVLHWVDEVGNALVEEVTWIQGQLPMDTLTSEQLHAYHEVHQDGDSLLRDAIGRFEGNVLELQTFSAYDRQIYVPLPFTFHRDAKNGLPISALQHDLTTFDFTIRNRNKLIIAKDVSSAPTTTVVLDNATQVSGGAMTLPGMMVEVVFLGKMEEKALSDNVSQHYFEFTQGPKTVSVAAGATSATIDNLGWNHSITSLWLCYRATSKLAAGTFDYFNFSTSLSTSYQPDRVDSAGAPKTGINRAENPFETIELQANSAPRVSRPGVYFHEIASYQSKVERRSSSHIMVYSFANNASEESEPSGAFNIGRAKTQPVQITLARSNAGATGIAEAGTIYAWSKTQAAFVIRGQKLVPLWSTR